MADVGENPCDNAGGGFVGKVALADAGHGDFAEDAVNFLDVDEHAGGGIDAAGDGGAEEEEGADAVKAWVAGEAIAAWAGGAGLDAEA
jgi:hypothetical protein